MFLFFVKNLEFVRRIELLMNKKQPNLCEYMNKITTLNKTKRKNDEHPNAY